MGAHRLRDAQNPQDTQATDARLIQTYTQNPDPSIEKHTQISEKEGFGTHITIRKMPILRIVTLKKELF